MKTQFEQRKMVKVYLDEAEYKWVELQANGNISRWGRERLLAEMVSVPNDNREAVARAPLKAQIRSMGAESTSQVVADPTPTAPTKKSKECAHGKGRGLHCWQCGGLAKVSE